MTTRTSRRTVKFKNSFLLSGLPEEQPAGDYIVETDEELLSGLSFLAFRRTQTLIHLHGKPGGSIVTQVLSIDPMELDAALKRDQASEECPPVQDAQDMTATEAANSLKKTADRRAVERAEDDGMRVHTD